MILRGLLDEELEEARHHLVAMYGENLGMRLDGQDAVARIALHHLRHAVGAPGRDAQFRGNIPDALVVAAVHSGGCESEHLGRHRSGHDADVVGRCGAVVGLPVAQLRLREVRRYVLPERAAHGHVDHLQAAADAEDGHAQLVGLLEEQQLEDVALVVHLAQLWMALVAVVGRVDIGTARHEQSVEHAHHGGQLLRVIGRGNEVGRAPCHRDGPDVVVAHREAVLLQGGGDADDGLTALHGLLGAQAVSTLVERSQLRSQPAVGLRNRALNGKEACHDGGKI